MYEPYPDLDVPPDTARIWRYTDLGKLVSLLHTRTLFFNRVDSFRDPYEGLPSRITRAEFETKESQVGALEQLFSLSRKWTYVNCWHINEFESAAMWDLYLKTHEGVAIETTVARLQQSFIAEKAETVYIGRVNYVDHETQRIPWSSGFLLNFHKRKSFERRVEGRRAKSADRSHRDHRSPALQRE